MSALAINELTSSDWADPISPGGPTIGEAALSFRSVRPPPRPWPRRAVRRRGGPGRPALRTGGPLPLTPCVAPPLCRSMHQSYNYVWVAIFAWGLGATLLNFACLVLLLAVLDGGCHGGAPPPSARHRASAARHADKGRSPPRSASRAGARAGPSLPAADRPAPLCLPRCSPQGRRDGV